MLRIGVLLSMRLRKSLVFLCLLTLLVPWLRIEGANAASTSGDISIVLDGQPLVTDAAPYVVPKANVTMVPIRVISENLGASVNWTQSAQTATISRGDATIRMTRGQKFAEVGDRIVSLDNTVDVKNGRIMVPLRFVGENLGVVVDWNAKNRTVTLTTSGGTGAGPGTGTGSDPGSNGGGANEGSTAMRGAWISTVYNLDWPSKASYNDAAKQQEEYRKTLDELQGMGINTVFVQVRPTGDALYPSSLVPWSKYLTGTQGRDPGYDPLAFLIEETHDRGMRFEAWFNPFRASVDATTTGLAANHVAIQHPDWVVPVQSSSGSKVTYLDPGVPDARQHIIDAILEVVNRYDIDGVHLDDYFYPSGVTFNDDASFKRYNDGGFAAKADWRRDNINRFVRQLSESIHAAKPKLAFGISPFGVWRNQSADPTGSDTKAGVTTYDSMFADVRTWIRSGWIDYVVPQIYWSLSFKNARYDVLADWWANEVRGTNVKLYIGHAPYKLGTTEAGWQSAQEIIDQLNYNKNRAEIQGDVYFSAKDLLRNPLGLAGELRKYYGS